MQLSMNKRKKDRQMKLEAQNNWLVQIKIALTGITHVIWIVIFYIFFLPDFANTIFSTNVDLLFFQFSPFENLFTLLSSKLSI